MLDEIQGKFERKTGLKPHLSTICRAIRSLRYSRKWVRLENNLRNR